MPLLNEQGDMEHFRAKKYKYYNYNPNLHLFSSIKAFKGVLSILKYDALFVL